MFSVCFLVAYDAVFHVFNACTAKYFSSNSYFEGEYKLRRVFAGFQNGAIACFARPANIWSAKTYKNWQIAEYVPIRTSNTALLCTTPYDRREESARCNLLILLSSARGQCNLNEHENERNSIIQLTWIYIGWKMKSEMTKIP